MLDAVTHVIAKDFLLDASQCGTHGGNLRYDIDAVAVLVNHSGKPAHLPFNSGQAFPGCILDVVAHVEYIPLPGTGYQPLGRRKSHGRHGTQ